MENISGYEYQLERPEIREFCLHALWEAAKYRKGAWIRLAAVIVLEFVIMPRIGVWVAGMIAVILLVSTVVNCIHIKKTISGYRWSVWLEGDMLKVDRDGSSSTVPCGSIQLIRTTRRLLMLGYLQTAQRPVWYIVPLRVFSGDEEQDRFLDRIRNPQAAEDGGSSAEPEAEGLHFAYTLNEAKWAHLQKDATGVIASGTFGVMERLRLVLVWGLFMTAAVLTGIYVASGHLVWQSVVCGLCLAVLITVRIFTRDPEKIFRRQVRTPSVRERECGAWQITLSETRVCAQLPTGARNYYEWETLGWFVETQDAFYLYYKDKRHHVTIAKESFQDWNQVSALHELCARKGVKYVLGRKMHYLPDWAFILMLVLFVLLGIALLFMDIFGDYEQETREQLRRASQGIYRQEGSDPAESRDDAAPDEQAEAPDSALNDFPDCVTLDEQVEVLESLGLQVPEELVESLRTAMEEPGMQAMIEEDYPYTWLLTDLGMPQYDDDWNVTGYAQDVFWFDFEGAGYQYVLEGMLALAQGSCLDTVTDIHEDSSEVDWEQGKGTIAVSLDWEGQTYHWYMDVYYDWIDGDVLGILNALLIEGKSQKFFYVTGDNGQGAIVFFCTAEWAEDFQEATGLELVNYRTWSIEQKKRMNAQ